MQPRRGLPPAPAFLPTAPHLSHYGSSASFTSSQGALTAQAVTSALLNPYTQTYTSGYHSSHYAQAYLQQGASGTQRSGTTEGGYTLSSSYVQAIPGPSSTPNSANQFSQNVYHNTNSTGNEKAPYMSSASQGSWYQFGNSQCLHPDCTFTGSQKSLEIHMMDRHLIYPPGWDHRKKKSDWDTDPSLKGKPIPIQGTTINLDDPEALDAWIAERKRRWPSLDRVEEKKRKIDEAVARGQIFVDVPALLRGKRRKIEEGPKNPQHREQTNDRGMGRGGGRGRGTDGGWRGRGRGGSAMQSGGDRDSALSADVRAAPNISPITVMGADGSENSDDDDASPEVFTSKPPPSVLIGHASSDENTPDQSVEVGVDETPLALRITKATKPVNKTRPPQPKKVPHNPFASRPTLLRNLLLPEIRVTVSNLSQAIRFLVANDFLADVEMKPGEAEERLIEVISNSPAL